MLGLVQNYKLNRTARSLSTNATPSLLLDWNNDSPTPYCGVYIEDPREVV